MIPLRIGFVTGATPDKWVRHWRDRRREPLELVPVTESDQTDGVRDGSLDMALVRLPADSDGLHCVRLYDEVQVAVASREHMLAAVHALPEISADALRLLPPDHDA